jgi:isoleucyl-tRNA synthetase
MKVIEHLETQKQLISVQDMVHRYPYDWRTKKPILLRATKQWFTDLTNIKELALDALKHVKVRL